MQTTLRNAFLLLALTAAPFAWSQSINVTTTGVGVNTTTPTTNFEVAGNAKVTGSLTTGTLVVGNNTVPSAFFESAVLNIPATNTTLLLNHGLGGVPIFVTISMRCVTAEYGWAVGDEVMINSVHMDGAQNGITTA
jgi:hypothetical protein